MLLCFYKKELQGGKMIDINYEKTSKLSTKDIYDIIAFSIDAAEDSGFMNSFIFNRALYLFAAIVLYPERKDELSSIVAKNINEAWDYLRDDGTLEKMTEDCSVELELLADYGKTWFEEYTEYAHSARGLLDTITTFSGDIVKSAVEQLRDASESTGVAQVLELADKWGMNNALPQEKKVKESDPDSLLE